MESAPTFNSIDLIQKVFGENQNLSSFFLNQYIDGIWHIEVGLENQIWLNKKLWDRLGYSIDSTFLLAKESDHVVFQSEIDDVFNWAKEMFSNPKKENTLLHTFNFFHKNGERVYMKSKGYPKFNEKGQLISLTGFCEDITETHEFKRMAIENNSAAKIGTWSMNLLSNEIYWDETTAAIHGHSADFKPKFEEAINFYKEGWSRNTITKTIEHVIETGETADKELIIIKSNGKQIWVRTIINCELKNGKPVKLYGIFQDINQIKKAEKLAAKNIALKSKNEELEQFAYIASHDIRAPLLTIKGYIQLLIEEHLEQSNEEAQFISNRTIDTIERLDHLMKDLLVYSKNSKIESLTQTSLDVCVNSAINNLASIIEDSKAKITIDSLPNVLGNSAKLTILFQNLISNALKFKNQDEIPEVKIKLENINEEYFKISVTDNGIGIPEQHLNDIFILFKRVHDKENIEGTGIGLAICKKIIELHNAKMDVSSKLGEFTRFELQFPVLQS